MANISIRNLPTDLHRRLKSAAAAHRRSLNQETIAILEEKLVAASSVTPLLPEF